MFWVYNPVSQIKILLFTKYCLSTISLCNGKPKVHTPPKCCTIFLHSHLSFIHTFIEWGAEGNIAILKWIRFHSWYIFQIIEHRKSFHEKLGLVTQRRLAIILKIRSKLTPFCFAILEDSDLPPIIGTEIMEQYVLWILILQTKKLYIWLH